MTRKNPIHKQDGQCSDPEFVPVMCEPYNVVQICVPHSDDWDKVTCEPCRAKMPKGHQ